MRFGQVDLHDPVIELFGSAFKHTPDTHINGVIVAIASVRQQGGKITDLDLQPCGQPFTEDHSVRLSIGERLALNNRNHTAEPSIFFRINADA